MAASNKTYIAWDGSQYEGDPPTGWYLAADNRWWPSQEQIRSGGSAMAEVPTGSPVPDGAELTTSDNHATTEQAPTAPPHRPQAPTAPPATATGPSPRSWAPEPAGTAAPPPTPPPAPPPTAGSQRGPQGPPTAPWAGQARPQGPQRRPRQRRRFKPGFLLPMLVFAFFRCSTNSSGSTDITFQPVPTQPPTTVAVGQPTDASTPAADGLQTFRSGDLEVTITGCGPAVITGSVRNIGNATSDFMTEITVEPTESSTIDQPRTITVSRLIAPLEVGESQPLMIPFGTELDGVISCNVIDVVSFN